MSEHFAGSDALARWSVRDAHADFELAQVQYLQAFDQIEQLCALPSIATALDAIIERFGVGQVAEVTGRTRRLIVGRDGRQKLQSRSPSANIAETQASMDGAKRILVFSDAGGTGRSYHGDPVAKNQARRLHFLLEPDWRADAAIQGLGRTNRTNQASAPLFKPVTTDVRGDRRFISTIARRLDSLGALTRGQRQTGGQKLLIRPTISKASAPRKRSIAGSACCSPASSKRAASGASKS